MNLVQTSRIAEEPDRGVPWWQHSKLHKNVHFHSLECLLQLFPQDRQVESGNKRQKTVSQLAHAGFHIPHHYSTNKINMNWNLNHCWPWRILYGLDKMDTYELKIQRILQEIFLKMSEGRTFDLELWPKLPLVCATNPQTHPLPIAILEEWL